MKLTGLPKIFNDLTYREVDSRRLITQTTERGLTLPGPSLQYCLVAGKTYRAGAAETELRDLFATQGWVLPHKAWLRSQLKSLATLAYEDDVAVMVAKLFEKG